MKAGERIGFFLMAFLLAAALLMYLEQCAAEGPVPLTATPPPSAAPSPGVTTTPAPRRMYLPTIMKGAGVQPASTVLKCVGLSGPYGAVGRLRVDCYYTWGAKQPVEAPPGDARFVPMLWGRFTEAWLDTAVATARDGSGWLLLFNEPDQKAQANMTPAEGAGLQHRVEQRAAGIKLASPAPSQDDPGWLWEMVVIYERKFGKKPRLDAICAHHYAFTGDWGDTRDYLLRVRKQALAHGYAESEIWLTEFGGECWTPGNHNRQIMGQLIPWMEAQPWMGRYFWFASMLPDPPLTLDLEYCSLTIPGTGELSELGKLYRGF